MKQFAGTQTGNAEIINLKNICDDGTVIDDSNQLNFQDFLKRKLTLLAV